MFLRNKRILLGVTGGIAAYKAAVLVRELRRAAAEVRVVMTRAATRFVGAATFQGLSGQPVEIDGAADSGPESAQGHPGNAVETDAHDDGMRHIQLSRQADFFLVAPASANTIAKMAHGYADNLLTSTYLAGNTPTAVAPAMNHLMWQHPATRANLRLLRQNGVLVWGPAEGEQACGEEGMGRLLEPQDIVSRLSDTFSHATLAGCKVVVTAGPTREALDAVRCLSNHSSGKMGFALARAAVEHGAEVVLIAGPVALSTPPAVKRIDVVSAEQMRAAVMRHIDGAAMFIACAAVADYRLPRPADTGKIKKHNESLHLHLVRTHDILAEAATLDPRPFLAGFAAETDHVEANAKSKLLGKNLDVIVANQVGPDAAYDFGDDVGKVDVYWRGGSESLGPEAKEVLGRRLLALFIHLYRRKSDAGSRERTG